MRDARMWCRQNVAIAIAIENDREGVDNAPTKSYAVCARSIIIGIGNLVCLLCRSPWTSDRRGWLQSNRRRIHRVLEPQELTRRQVQTRFAHNAHLFGSDAAALTVHMPLNMELAQSIFLVVEVNFLRTHNISTCQPKFSALL